MLKEQLSLTALAAKVPASRRGTAAFILVMLGSLGIQSSTALVSGLFDQFSPMAVAGLRMGCAAIILLIFVRPNPAALKKYDWPQVLIYGFVVVLMTLGYFNAVKYIPLGIAVTIEYLGAFVISLVGIRRWQDSLLSLGALLGVILITGPTIESHQLQGYLWAALSACCMAGYTFLSARMVGGSPALAGLKGLTLSVTLAAILLLPWSLPAAGAVDSSGWLRIFAAGTLGVALAYSADAIAGKLTSAAVIGVLFSLDPVNGALIGILMMGQLLPWPAYLGIVLITVSGAVLVWKTNRSAISISSHTAMLQVLANPATGQQSQLGHKKTRDT